MHTLFEGLAFGPTDILLPQGCDLTKWSVVACDQYTSQPEYWAGVERRVGSAPSALRLILPEGCLEGPNVDTDIVEVNTAMTRYLRQGQFRTLEDSLVYVERTLSTGKVRRGLVGAVDLEQYDDEPGSTLPVRGAEGTVLGRVPPRIAARKNAPLELSHVLLLCDDPQGAVFGPLPGRKGQMESLYDFELMEQGGHLRGWRLDGESLALVAHALRKLWEPDALRERYGLGEGKTPFQLAVGDGNHALAAAKACYERQKRLTPPEKWAELPSRYALCEMVDLHDEALTFQPIHRVVFGIKGEDLLDALGRAFPGASEGSCSGDPLPYVWEGGEGVLHLPEDPGEPLVARLQSFLDEYVKARGGSIDYIHGAEVARELGRRGGNMAFLLPAPDREGLFPLLLRGETLPRKAFSVGEAHDKRFYLEARRIRV